MVVSSEPGVSEEQKGQWGKPGPASAATEESIDKQIDPGEHPQ